MATNNLLGRLREWQQTLTSINAQSPTAADVSQLRHAQTCWFSWDRRDEKTLSSEELNILLEHGRLCDAKIRAAAVACGFRSSEISELFSNNPLIRANAWKNLAALIGVAKPAMPQPAAAPAPAAALVPDLLGDNRERSAAGPIVSPPVVDSDFTEPIAKSTWCVLLCCSRGTLRTRLQNGTYRAKPGTVKTAKLVAMHIDGLPKELKAAHDRKRKVDEVEVARKKPAPKS